MKVLVTGGCGYIGSKLVQNLAKNDLDVTVLDTFWFGNPHGNNPKVRVIKGDTRNVSKLFNESFDCVVHLANVANDPSVQLNELLSWEINALGTFELLEWAKKSSKNLFSQALVVSMEFPKSLELRKLLPEIQFQLIIKLKWLLSKSYFHILMISILHV